MSGGSRGRMFCFCRCTGERDGSGTQQSGLLSTSACPSSHIPQGRPFPARVLLGLPSPGPGHLNIPNHPSWQNLFIKPVHDLIDRPAHHLGCSQPHVSEEGTDAQTDSMTGSTPSGTAGPGRGPGDVTSEPTFPPGDSLVPSPTKHQRWGLPHPALPTPSKASSPPLPLPRTTPQLRQVSGPASAHSQDDLLHVRLVSLT